MFWCCWKIENWVVGTIIKGGKLFPTGKACNSKRDQILVQFSLFLPLRFCVAWYSSWKLIHRDFSFYFSSFDFLTADVLSKKILKSRNPLDSLSFLNFFQLWISCWCWLTMIGKNHFSFMKQTAASGLKLNSFLRLHAVFLCSPLIEEMWRTFFQFSQVIICDSQQIPFLILLLLIFWQCISDKWSPFRQFITHPCD